MILLRDAGKAALILRVPLRSFLITREPLRIVRIVIGDPLSR